MKWVNFSISIASGGRKPPIRDGFEKRFLDFQKLSTILSSRQSP
jgi:hypothetical protein